MKSINSLALILSTSFLGRAARLGPACTSVCCEGCLPWSALCAVFVRVASPGLRSVLSFRGLPFLQMRASPAPLALLPSAIALHLQGSDKPSASVTLVTAAFCLTCLALACLLAVALACSYYSYPCPRISGPDHAPILALFV